MASPLHLPGGGVRRSTRWTHLAAGMPAVADREAPMGLAPRQHVQDRRLTGLLVVAVLLCPAWVVAARPSAWIAFVVPAILAVLGALAARRQGFAWVGAGMEALGALGVALFSAWLAGALV